MHQASRHPVNRPYTRCQSCGAKYQAPRSSAVCSECKDGQAHFWPIPYAPASFVPLPTGRK